MSHFIEVESVNSLDPSQRAKVLLNLDAVIQFIDVGERLTVAVTQKAELDGVDFICGRAKRPLSVCLPYSLAEVRQIIARATTENLL